MRNAEADFILTTTVDGSYTEFNVQFSVQTSMKFMLILRAHAVPMPIESRNV